MKLTQELLQELLSYNTITGKLSWQTRDRQWFTSDRVWKIWNTKLANQEAFSYINGSGYRWGRVLGKNYLGHRIIWFMAYGYWPNQIDHIDGDRANNSLHNLRDVTNQINSMNIKIPSSNTSGHIGVCWDKSRNKWLAHITVDKKLKNLGRFINKEDAVKVRKEAEEKYGFHENHGRILDD